MYVCIRTKSYGSSYDFLINKRMPYACESIIRFHEQPYDVHAVAIKQHAVWCTVNVYHTAGSMIYTKRMTYVRTYGILHVRIHTTYSMYPSRRLGSLTYRMQYDRHLFFLLVGRPTHE